MTTDRARHAVVIAACIVAAGLPGYRGASYAGDDSQNREMASRFQEAVDAASPNDATQIYPRLVRAQGSNLSDILIYGYDYDEIERLETHYQGVSRAEFLRQVFARAMKGHENSNDNEKWLAVINYFSRTMRHPPIEQPMYRDRTMVTDPLILLQLHEGRCGHQARVVVDLSHSQSL